MQIAGQGADGSRRNWISGNFMRQMARSVMDRCILPRVTGGYVTRGFAKQLNYVTAPTTKYEDAFRKYGKEAPAQGTIQRVWDRNR